jgi:RNA polymerase sigma factor (sigma-70 family)
MHTPQTDPDYLRFRDRLIAAARRRLNGSQADAEDVVQEAYLKLFSQGAREVHSPEAWMFKVIKNLAVDQIRRRQLDRAARATRALDVQNPGQDSVFEADPELDRVLTPEAILYNRQMSIIALRTLVDCLDQTEVLLWLLREVFDFSYDDLAKLIGKTEAATRQAIHRSRHRLRANPSTKKLRSLEEQEAAQALLQVCWLAVSTSDLAPLQAFINTPPTQCIEFNRTRVEVPDSNRTLATESTLVQVGGQFALALTLDGVRLCTLPLGPIAILQAFEMAEST